MILLIFCAPTIYLFYYNNYIVTILHLNFHQISAEVEIPRKQLPVSEGRVAKQCKIKIRVPI